MVKADVMTQCDARLPQARVKLADYTTWRVGGAAEWLAEPASLEETQAWICLLYTSPSPRDRG